MNSAEAPYIATEVAQRRRGAVASVPCTRTELISGREEIRAQAAMLNGFLRECEDADSLGSVETWLRDVEAHQGRPVATLVYEEDRLAAVLLSVELTVAGCRTRLAFAGNMTGHCGVFIRSSATMDQRTRRTLVAADALVRQGQMLGLLLSVKQTPERRHGAAAEVLHSARISAESTRDVYDTFDLQADFEGSLSRLGAHTRRNLRYYRRRADRELQTEFHSNLEGADLRDAVLDLRGAMPAELPAGILKNRIAQVARKPEAFCMGVRAGDGRWLSWVSGWRAGRYTYIDWQCNRDGFARYSLSTVMRSHLIEQESRLAQLQIRFLGGTPHTMHYGFREESCTDWLFTADSLGGAGMEAALRLVAWLRRKLKPAQVAGASRDASTRAPRRHRVAALLVRMVGVMLRAEQA